jgi:hypothetical protein
VESGDASGQQLLYAYDQCIIVNNCYYAPDPTVCMNTYCSNETTACMNDI